MKSLSGGLGPKTRRPPGGLCRALRILVFLLFCCWDTARVYTGEYPIPLPLSRALSPPSADQAGNESEKATGKWSDSFGGKQCDPLQLREQGVSSEKRYLFVVDGAKALRAGIEEVFGCNQPVQRCRTHKIRNVLEQLPTEQHAQVRSLMRAAYKLPKAKEGIAKMEKMAEWLEREYPAAARSLREGLEETFTINRLDLPPSLHRCLGTTNLIESPQSGVRKRTGNVCRWREADMVMRWVAGAYLITEKNFRKIMGHDNLWTLAAVLGRSKKSVTLEEKFA